LKINEDCTTTKHDRLTPLVLIDAYTHHTFKKGVVWRIYVSFNQICQMWTDTYDS